MRTSTVKRFFLFLVLIVSLVSSSLESLGQTITGTVYRDFNSNGIYESIANPANATYGEPGIAGVIVTAYGSASTTAPISTTTSATGGYTLAVGSTSQYRLEFTNLVSGDFVSFSGANNGTNIQFVAGGTTNANLGVNYAQNYCDTQNPPVYATRFVQNAIPANSNFTDDVVVSFPYTTSGTSTTPSRWARAGQVGSVWGLAYDRTRRKVYSAAFLKRHAGFGPSGTGAIYSTDVTGNATNATTLVNLDLLGFDTGTDPHETLPNDPLQPSHDSNSFLQVGKMGLGGLTISDDDQYLYTINLFDRKLYRIPTTSPTAANIISWSIPSPCTNVLDFRPFAVKYYRGKVYVGVTCTSESNQDRTALGQPGNTRITATVYEFDGTTFTQVLSFALSNFKRGRVGDNGMAGSESDRWHPWLTNTNVGSWLSAENGDQYAYPQPLLSDIDFDVNGEMIVSIMDRFGHQMGYRNYPPDANDNTLIRGWANGDQLRAARCSSANQFTLESNGSVCGRPVASASAQNNQGPGGGEFYYQDNALNDFHREISNGGISLLAGSNELAVSAMDPVNNTFTGGIRWFNNTTGTTTRGFQLYSSTDPGSFGKASGTGDLVLQCASAPIEIGNRVWADLNNNGVQDAGELPLVGVQVTLKGAGLPPSGATVTTDAKGEYYFSSGNGASATGYAYGLPLSYGGSYSLSFPTSFSSLILSSKNNAATGDNADNIDSDVDASGVVNFTLGQAGQNNFSYDVAYLTTSACVLSAAITGTTCNTATNQYTVTGTINFANAGTGPFTISDGQATTTLAAGTSPQSFTLSGASLMANQSVHTLTVTSAGSDCGVASTTYTAPASCAGVSTPTCTLNAVATAGSCSTVNNGGTVSSVYNSSVTVSLVNPTVGTLTITDGSQTLTFAVTPSTNVITGVFNGLSADNSTHVVTISLPGCGNTTAIYQAPNPCQPVALNSSLKLDKQVSLSKAQKGNVLTYTLVLTNTGSTPASTVVRDSLGSGLTYVSGSASAPDGTVFTAGKPVSLWSIPNISSGQSLSMTFRVTADSTGILYNFATIPGDTAIVCTSVPVVVCTGDQYTFRLTAKPGRSSYRWYRNGEELTSQTSNVLDVVQPGEYSLAVDNVTGKCPDFSCCPFIVEENALPTFTANIILPTCTGGSSQNNGQIVLTNFQGSYTYQYSQGADFNPAASLSGPAKAVPINGILVNSLQNAATTTQYTVRVYNTSGCYTDVTLTLPVTQCSCLLEVTTATASQCQTATNQYSVSGTLSLTNAQAGTLTITDGNTTTTLSVTAGQTTAPFALTGLSSGTGSHTLTANLNGCSTARTTYTAPASCQQNSPSTTLSLTKFVDKPKASQGSILTYTLILTNGGSTSRSTTVRDSLSTGATYVPGSATASTGTSFVAGAPISVWTIPNIAAGQSLSLTYQAKADSAGILYNMATIPGDTAIVCTSIPVEVCAGKPFTIRLTAPAGRSKYQWFRTANGVTTELTSFTTNILDITQLGEYKLSVDSLSGKCPNFSCCPFIVEEDKLAAIKATTTPVSCVGSTPQTNGQIVLTNFQGSYTYQYSEGTSFNAGAVLSGSAKLIPTNGVLASTLVNPTGDKHYTVRIYNNWGCFTDLTVTLQPSQCNCSVAAVTATASQCEPTTNQYSITGTVSISNSSAGILTISDGAFSTTLSVNAGQTSASFSLTGLPSGTGSHSLTASIIGCSSASATYTAPVSCSVAPVLPPALALAITPGECLSATNQYTLSGTLSLTNTQASSLTLTDGLVSTTVSLTAGQTTASFALTGLSSGTNNHTVTLSGTGYSPISTTYTAPSSCSVAPVLPPALALAITPGECLSATNQYTLSGTLSLTNAQTSSLTITDGLVSTTVSLTAGQTTASFALTGLSSGTNTHTLTVSGQGYSPISTTYTAPVSCSVAPVLPPALALAITPGECLSATNQYTLSGTLSLTNAQASSLTITDGLVSTTVSLTAGQTTASFALTGLSSGTNTHTLTVSGQGYSPISTTYTAPVSCSVAPILPPALALAITPGECQTATNQYTLSGTLSLTNTQAASLTITDGLVSTTVSLTAGQTTASFSLTGLSSGTNTHTVTVSGQGYSPVSATYTAPVSCSVAPVLPPALALAITPGECLSATNQYTLSGTLSLTNAQASSLTITDGLVSTTVSLTAGQTTASFALTGLSSGTNTHTVTVSGTGYNPVSATYTAPSSCSVAPVLPPALALAITPGECLSATNQYTLSGTLSLTNAQASSLTITDGLVSTTVSLTAGQTTASFSLTGLSSGTNTHTVTVSGQGYSPISTTYTAPVSCSVAPILPPALALAITPGECQTATNQYTLSGTLSLTNTQAASLTITDGLVSTTVSLTAGQTTASFSLTGLSSGTNTHTVTVSGQGYSPVSATYTAPVSCSVAPVLPPALALAITPGECLSATNQYTLSGTLSLSNAQTSSLTITDGLVSTTVSLTAGQTTASFALTGLSSGTNTHTLTVSGQGYSSISTTYTAPSSCSVAPVLPPALALTITPGECLSATNQYTLSGTLSLTNTQASSLTITDGLVSTTVSLTAGQTTASFSLTGLSSGTNTHTVTVSGTGYNPVSATYTAPSSCSVAPVLPPALALAITPGECLSA
ncbi:SdrD B-like domain-containing protein, partial [Spirosoma soli]